MPPPLSSCSWRFLASFHCPRAFSERRGHFFGGEGVVQNIRWRPNWEVYHICQCAIICGTICTMCHIVEYVKYARFSSVSIRLTAGLTCWFSGFLRVPGNWRLLVSKADARGRRDRLEAKFRFEDHFPFVCVVFFHIRSSVALILRSWPQVVYIAIIVECAVLCPVEYPRVLHNHFRTCWFRHF